MEQYIKKSALVAEIENLENTYKKCPTRNSYEEGLKYGRLIGYKDALHKINTLEVKEVDLEKEAEFIANDIMIGVQANRYNTVVYNTKRCDFNHSHLMLAARKGIELGIKAQQGKA